MTNKLDAFSGIYNSLDGDLNKDINSYNVTELVLIKNLIGGDAVQLGLGDGFVAANLAKYYSRLVVVEGSEEVIRSNYDKNAGYTVVHSMFEDYQPEQKFDIVLGNHVLEHVDHPVAVLKTVNKWMKPAGRAIFTVPNATSLHRRIGVEMGLLGVLHEFNQQDIELGHQRVYNSYQFTQDIREAGYTILESGGYMIKLVSNKQMKDWPKELLRAIFKTSLTLPAEVCSNLSVICTK